MNAFNIPQSNHPRVIIVGGGFGGVTLSRKLTKLQLQVVLIDQNNYHTFQPLLYQVATSGLEPDSIAFPLRGITDNQENFFFRMAQVTQVVPEKNEIETNIGKLQFDYLILATGTKTNYFNNQQIENSSMGMKSVVESLNIRSTMLKNFEKATITASEKERKKLMRIVISGAGPTGVELAGAFAEFKKGVVPKDYPDINPENMEIHLIDGSDRVLSSMSEASSKKSLKYLEKLGVNIHLNTLVKNYEDDVISTNTDLNLEASTFIWSAGVIGNHIPGIKEDSFHEKTQRYRVDEYNRIMGYESIYAVGDIALMETDDYPKGHPQVAQPAIQQGKNLAKNFKRLLREKPLKPFSYFDKGSMATIGRNKAVADVRSFTIGGFAAWFTWLAVHLYFLVGVRNRVVVFLNWIYNYFNFDRAARLILQPERSKAAPKN
ncbi:NAD(P)/FAD-dependent oxidoreductase [Nonlabens sp. SCSIO 43208]|uniref:NAD(P)/FAD-dependent oxidoreductase n=1 Tax=Nonlabens sp. SCSIO 43208 TaxID=2793009 RepID=UPI003D6BDB50